MDPQLRMIHFHQKGLADHTHTIQTFSSPKFVCLVPYLGIVVCRRVTKQQMHGLRGVPIAIPHRLLSNRSRFLDRLRGKFDVSSCQVLLEVLLMQVLAKTQNDRFRFCTHLDFFGSRNGNDVFPLCKEPRKRHLPGRRVVLFANILEIFCQSQDLGEVFLRVPAYQS